MSDFRSIPSVDLLLNRAEVKQLRLEFGDALVLEAVRHVLEGFRGRTNPRQDKFDFPLFFGLVKKYLEEATRLSLVRVINATGVILHTNLGRAVLCEEAQAQIGQISRGYSALEFNLESGGRGSRAVHTNHLLCRLSGAEAALVVNNNAAAVLLTLTALAKGRKVIISRGQLVEIGGGFRVPEVMRVSGAKLVEVGTTNRVHLDDYTEALRNGAGLVMRAHASNFKIIGFTEAPALKELVELAHHHDALFIDDIGSGTLIDTGQFGLSREPLVQDSISAGADIVCFSGDKLLGGPQAGIIAGRKELVAKIEKHPLARAVRADKLCLAGLESTLQHYLKGDALETIPVWKMISMRTEDIRSRAMRWQQALGAGEVRDDLSTIGGGSLPGETLATAVLAIRVKQADTALASLRHNPPPIIGRIKDDQILFDPRTVLESEDQALLGGIKNIFNKEQA